MAKYRITAPDGGTYEVTAPDDATQDQVLAYAQANYKPAAAPRAPKPADDSIARLEAAQRNAYAGTGTDQYGGGGGPPIQDMPAVQAERPTAEEIHGGGLGGLYGRYMAGVGNSMVSTASGLRQNIVDQVARGVNVAKSVADRIDPVASERAAAPILNYQQKLRDDEAARRQSLAGARSDPAFMFGDIVGNVGQLFIPGAAARGTSVGRMSMPTTVGGNALQGLAFGGIQPIAAEGERSRNALVGAAGGGTGAAIPKVIGAVASPLMRLTGQGTNSIDTAAGRQIAQESGGVRNLLVPQPSAVQGVQRTLGEESLDPGVMALENTLRARNRAAFDQIDTRNNVARVGALERIAGTDADMVAAEATRDAASGSARAQAMSAGPVDMSRTVSLIDDAIDSQQGRPAIQSGLRQIRGLLAKDVESAPGLVTVEPESRIEVIENVRKTIGDMLSGKYGGDNAQSLAGSRELLAVRDALNDEVSGQVPAFGQYLDAFRNASKPINRMDTGRELITRSSGTVPDETGTLRITPAGFSRASTDLDTIAARATGFKKAKASDILTAEDLASIRAIQDDMQRQFKRQGSAATNSATAERTSIGERLGVKSAMRALPMGVGDFVQMLEQSKNQRVQERLAYLVANPAEARRVLASLDREGRVTLNKALLQLSARTGASIPALAE